MVRCRVDAAVDAGVAPSARYHDMPVLRVQRQQPPMKAGVGAYLQLALPAQRGGAAAESCYRCGRIRSVCRKSVDGVDSGGLRGDRAARHAVAGV